eukprot:GFYU01013783.1.p1 GENE.GFYU01013783.1~~GFYU01013783.1.p1  ORF type:complete len:273 (-),score=48.48 GFYU01013783.1:322-1140(-)
MYTLSKAAVTMLRQRLAGPIPLAGSVAIATQHLPARYDSYRMYSDATCEDNNSSNDSNDDDDTTVKNKVLEAALTHVHTLGWSVDALTAGAQDLNLSGMSHGMFDRGEIELVDYFIHTSDQQMSKHFQGQDLSQMRVKSRLQQIMKYRLAMITPYASTWHQAMALRLHPSNAPLSMRSKANAMDEIWFLAGDRSSDFGWYLKRAALGTVYTSTEFYLVSDMSPHFHETWEFLDRRLDDMQSSLQMAKEAENVIHTSAGNALAPILQLITGRK